MAQMKYNNFRFKDFASFKYGKMPKKEKMLDSEGFPIFSGYRISGYYDEYNLDSGELIVVARGVGGTGDVKLSPEKCFLTNLSIAVQVDEKIALKRYLYYYFALNNLRYLDSGSAQSQITINDLSNIKILLPEVSIQTKIVKILTDIDIKIEINNKINDNLLRQARALLNNCLDENQSVLTMRKLLDIAEINVDTYSPAENWSYVNYLDTSNITEGTISEMQHLKPNEDKLPSRARRKVKPMDIVYSTVRPNQRHYGIVNTPLPNMLVSTGFAVIRSKVAFIRNEYIYLLLTDNQFVEKMQQLAEQSTSTFPAIKPSDLGTCQIPCVDNKSMELLGDAIHTIFSTISVNQQENIKLVQLRDALLPKLLAGQIDVSKIEI